MKHRATSVGAAAVSALLALSLGATTASSAEDRQEVPSFVDAAPSDAEMGDRVIVTVEDWDKNPELALDDQELVAAIERFEQSEAAISSPFSLKDTQVNDDEMAPTSVCTVGILCGRVWVSWVSKTGVMVLDADNNNYRWIEKGKYSTRYMRDADFVITPSGSRSVLTYAGVPYVIGAGVHKIYDTPGYYTYTRVR